MPVYSMNGVDLNDTVYAKSGLTLLQAYDIDTNELIHVVPPTPSPTIELVEDYATGTYFGYHYNVQNDGTEYKFFDVTNLLQYDPNLQSFSYNPDTERFYEFDESNKIRVYDKNLNHLELLYNYDLGGHCNDTVYYNGMFFFPDLDTGPGVYWWKTDNTAGHLPVYGIEQPTTESERRTVAICKAEGNNDLLYLVCGDYTQDELYTHDPADKISIYLYNPSTYEATLQTEFKFIDRFIQGAYVYNGVLYVSLNIMTARGEPDAGIVLRAYTVDGWETLSPLYAYGDFEPEGLNIYPFTESNKPEFMFGIGKYQTLSEIVRCTIPYRIVYPNN